MPSGDGLIKTRNTVDDRRNGAYRSDSGSRPRTVYAGSAPAECLGQNHLSPDARGGCVP